MGIPITNMPFAGASCDPKEKVCRVWWLQTINNKTITSEIKIPFDDVLGGGKANKEYTLEDMFRNSEAEIQGAEA